MFLLLPTFVLLSSLTISYGTSFDFIIVGAGTSGCVLASRLCTRLPKATILLLERGLPRDAEAEFLVRAVGNADNVWQDPRVSETILTLPNAGLNNRTVIQVTGNTLGGSSSINGMQWTVPIKESINGWRIPGLNSKTSNKYYKRAFRQLNVKIPSEQNRQTYSSLYLNASVAAGIPKLDNPFRMKIQQGIWNTYLSEDNGRRLDSCTAYLSPVMHTACAQNFRLVQAATVRKVITKKKKTSNHVFATGVEYVHSLDRNQTSVKTAHARYEVVIAAGPIGSPKLLQLSGIGSRNLMKKVNIKQVKDIPVGEVTQGRSFIPELYSYTNLPVPPENNPEVYLRRSERQKFAKGEESTFNIATTFMNAIIGKSGYATASFIGRDKESIGERRIFQGCVSNPKSFGWLRVKSKDPFEMPEIQLNLMNDKTEVNETLKCLEKIEEITKKFETPIKFTPLRNETGEKFVRNTASSGFHFVGGCAVGKVVTGEFKVKGMERLRVVDSSVMRRMPMSAGPLGSTYMIAEFAAEKLVKQYRCQFGNEKCKKTGKNY